MKKYFIALDEMTLEEIEIWRLLCRYSNYDTDVAGYTVNQLVVGADKRLNLTTQKVRTILKKFEKEGYIQFLSSGSKGKESTLKLTIKQQLFNNNTTNKSEHSQQIEDLDNNNVTTNQQQSNNTTKKKENNIYKDLSFIDLNSVKVTEKDYIKLIELAKGDIELVHDKMLSLEIGIVNRNKKYLEYKSHYLALRQWINKENKKAPSKKQGTQNNNSVNPNICNTGGKYTRGVEVW